MQEGKHKGLESKRAAADLPPMGFIAIDIALHRPPGDPFNEATWSFPLIRELVPGANETLVVSSKPYEASLIDAFVDAGHRLVSRGAVGVITSCGFLATCQRELASRLPIPVATSSLVQIPSILAFLPPGRTVGVLTYDEARLTPQHLEGIGINPSRCRIAGAPPLGGLRAHIQAGREYVHAEIEDELAGVAASLVRDHPDVAAICLECTNMPPFAEAIQRAVGPAVPVYDVYTMGEWFYGGLVRGRLARWGHIEKDLVETRR